MSYKKLLSLIIDEDTHKVSNVAKQLDEEARSIAMRQFVAGYEADLTSREHWLDANEAATKLMNNIEEKEGIRDFPFKKPCEVILPMLAPAAISFASRLVPHIKQNNVTVKHTVFGADPDGSLYQKAERRTDYLNFKLLGESSSWLLETHKLLTIVATWGIAFRKVYYDRLQGKNVSDLIHPRDVIINHQTQSLEKVSRYTIRNYWTKNDLQARINAGVFLDVDLEKLDDHENEYRENESDDEFPVYEILEQACLLDLDDDGYCEPYIAVFHPGSELLFGIFPHFGIEDIRLNEATDSIINIKRKNDLVAYFGIDNPDGGFYSVGLNSLLYGLNKGADSLFRQLVDSGTLANQQAGFVTRAVRPQERSLQFSLGEFKVIDAPPNIDLKQHIMPLPFQEPSQVLFQLLGLLMQTGKEVGFITEVLTGETSGQNVPATTMLALIEQGTRAFKPVVEKLFLSLKSEFQLHTDLIYKYTDPEEYKKFHGLEQVGADLKEYDYGDTRLKITPVADPTMSSEAHRYAQIQAVGQMLQQGGIPNPIAGIKFYLEGLQIPNIEEFLTPPQQEAPPDPKILQVQAQQEIAAMKQQVEQLKISNSQREAEMKHEIELLKLEIEKSLAQAQIGKLQVDAVSARIEASQASEELSIKQRLANVQEEKMDIDRQKLAQQSSKANSESK